MKSLFPGHTSGAEVSSAGVDYSRFFHLFTTISKAIHSGGNTTEILEQIVSNIADVFEAKGCIFWIVDTGQQSITEKISHGFSYRNLVEIDYQTLMKIFGHEDENYVFIEDAHYDPRIPNLDRIGKKRVSSITAFHFDIIKSYRGILAVYFTQPRKLSDDEREVVTALGEQGAIALQKSLSFNEKMLETFRQIVEGFTLALEAKDEQTHGHSLRVAAFAREVARQMKLSRDMVETIYHGGLLHDIGKIGMQDDIIQRLGILSRREMDSVRQHPIVGARITQPLVFLSDVAPLIRHHHERWDGSGYPDGLMKENIPLGARIITVCDAFETMISGRKHLEKMKLEDAIVNLEYGAGKHFDPQAVLGLYDVIERCPEIIGEKLASPRILEIHRRNISVRKSGPNRSSASMFI